MKVNSVYATDDLLNRMLKTKRTIINAAEKQDDNFWLLCSSISVICLDS